MLVETTRQSVGGGGYTHRPFPHSFLRHPSAKDKKALHNYCAQMVQISAALIHLEIKTIPRCRDSELDLLPRVFSSESIHSEQLQLGVLCCHCCPLELFLLVANQKWSAAVDISTLPRPREQCCRHGPSSRHLRRGS